MTDFIETELKVQASAELEEEIKNDLEEDPEGEEKARAAIQALKDIDSNEQSQSC